MSAENESMYLVEYIEESLVNGELPRDFSLPEEVTNNSLPYADGTKDGIVIYHSYPSEMAEKSQLFLDEMLRAAGEGNLESAFICLLGFATMNSAISVVREFQQYIAKQDLIEHDKLYTFALACLLHCDADIIKYGLLMTAMYPESFDRERDVIRTLGLCNEFTIYAIFNMLHWSNGNDEIFALAKKVHGWGRIHAVRYLQPENDEIKKWLLEEGIHNDILPEYTEEEVRRKFMDDTDTSEL